MDDNLPEHIRDFKLETRFLGNGQIAHILNDANTSSLSPKVAETWTREKRCIGRGGQGRVILQTCTSGSRVGAQRAVKIIPFHPGSKRRRYIAELKTNIKFSHDKYSSHFVKTLGWYESKNHLYIAMTYYPLGDLMAYLDENSVSEDGARQITIQVLQGLSIMHQEGYAHRDIKPQNILIQKHPHSPQFDSWWVKLADFGITKKLEGSSDVTTAVIGTVGFMAPELFHGSSSRSVDHMAADIWALGALTYFTLTKEHIFPHTKRLFQYEEAPDTHFPSRELDGCGVSQEGQAFLRALMKPESSDRPNTVEASRQSWVRSWMPHEPEFWDAQSESSVSSPPSSRSSSEMERGLTTVVSLDTQCRTIVPSNSVQKRPPEELQLNACQKEPVPVPSTRRDSYGSHRYVSSIVSGTEIASKSADPPSRRQSRGSGLNDEYFSTPAPRAYRPPVARYYDLPSDDYYRSRSRRSSGSTYSRGYQTPRDSLELYVGRDRRVSLTRQGPSVSTQKSGLRALFKRAFT